MRSFLSVCAVAAAAVGLTGCETMMFHVKLTDTAARAIAQGNAMVNECLARDLLSPRLAYPFSAISAQTLDITVVDEELYKSTYEMYARQYRNEVFMDDECSELARGLPQGTRLLQAQYLDVSRRLSAGRAEESRQWLATMNSFSQNISRFGVSSMVRAPAADARAPYWPKVSYSQERPDSVGYLVNTSKGMVQCRVTSKNFVFCL